MKLSALRLKNYRCFADLTMSLHPQLTVIVAENGQGKTSILDAIRVGLWPFLNSFDLASSGYNDPANAIAIDDVHISVLEESLLSDSFVLSQSPLSGSRTISRNLPVEVALTGDWGHSGEQETWMRYRDSERARTKTKDDVHTRSMKSWADKAQKQIRSSDEGYLNLPMLGYYGTGRLWSEKKLMRNKATKENSDSASFYMRAFAYRDCMDPASSFKAFKDWFIWLSQAYAQVQAEQLERQQAGQTTVPPIPPAMSDPLNVVRACINDVLQEPTGWHNLRYSVWHEKSLILQHEVYGSLKVDQLSDGIRTMIGMVADIAYRCAQLNPQLGADAAKETQGVVLIDEVDMHLHPKWQQLVLGQLTRAFPKIQFIVTTHSPQVLSTVRREHIRVLGTNSIGCAIAEPPLAHTYGEPSGSVLHSVMHVDPQPPIIERVALQRLTELVDQGEYANEEASQLQEQLALVLGAQHPQLQRLQRSIARQKALKQ